jgi:hypothetical protein
MYVASHNQIPELTIVFSTTHDKYAPIVVSYSVPSRPPTPEPKPTFGSPAHLRSIFSGPHLPPFLQFRFPLNVLFITLIPLLIPIGITGVFIKLALDSSKSRKRLKLLEKDENFKDRLVNALRKMDKDMENAIVELIDEVCEEEESAAGNIANKAQIEIQSDPKDRSVSGSPSSSSTVAKITGESHLPADAPVAPGAPVFSDMQLRIISTLNDLPFNKYAACFPGVFSSHAVIVSRDRKRFAFHVQGEPVLQHFADHFIL